MRRGFFFTLDVSIALMLLMTVSILSFAYFGRMQSSDFESALQYSSLQDVSNLVARRGCLQDMACPASGAPDPSCIENILSATSDSTCFDVSGYEVASYGADGAPSPSNAILRFTVAKQACTYSGGALQVIYFPFSCKANQSGSRNILSSARAWQKGVPR